MRKLLCLVLTACMLSVGVTAFAAEQGDAYLETSNLIAVETLVYDQFDAGTCDWANRGSTASWVNATDFNGKTGYLRGSNNNGTVSIQRTISVPQKYITNNNYYRVSFKMKSAQAGNFQLYLSYDSTPPANVSFYQQFANQWREFSSCTAPLKGTSIQMGIYRTSATADIDIDDFKVEVMPMDNTNGYSTAITSLPEGTYTIPSKVWQNSDSAVSGKVISALYSGSNEMLDVDVADFTTTGTQGEYVEVYTSLDVPANLDANAYVKSFLWDGFSEIMPYCPSSQAHDEELDLHNGDFEIKTKLPGYIGDAWGRRGTGGTAEWTSEAAHSGKYGIKFQGGSGGIVNYFGIRNAFGSTATATTDFKLKFWAKAEGGTSPQLKLYIIGANGAATAVSGTVSTDYQVEIGTEWAEYTLTIPKSFYTGFTNNHLFLGTYGGGTTNATTFYLDDVRIIRN